MLTADLPIMPRKHKNCATDMSFEIQVAYLFLATQIEIKKSAD